MKSFGNLLKQALSILPKQNFYLYKFQATSINDCGIKQDTYSNKISLAGSIQSIPKDMYQKLGLDFAKNYKMIYCDYDIKGLSQSNESPDKVEIDGIIFIVVSDTNWFKQDGWNGVLVVEQMKEGN